MRDKYKFEEFSTTEINSDPIFNSKNFHLYGDVMKDFNAPLLFIVDNYRYVLIKAEDFNLNKNFCFKVATYLYHHETSNSDGTSYTYFFGNINDCKEIGQEFTNQVCKYVSYEMVEEWYPKTLRETSDYIINFFLSKQKYYGQEFMLKNYNLYYVLFLSKELPVEEFRKSKNFIWNHLESYGYLEIKREGDIAKSIIITNRAIENFQKTKGKDNSKLAFKAIKFNDNKERIQVIQNAIVECGFEPRIMNEYETNNWIMPEIFHQIKICKFVVVDLSLRCDGAYYEAGYAHAMGKEVIHIYDERESVSNPLHFDVAQKSTVIYKDFDDLKMKLRNRIKATIN